MSNCKLRLATLCCAERLRALSLLPLILRKVRFCARSQAGSSTSCAAQQPGGTLAGHQQVWSHRHPQSRCSTAAVLTLPKHCPISIKQDLQHSSANCFRGIGSLSPPTVCIRD